MYKIMDTVSEKGNKWMLPRFNAFELPRDLFSIVPHDLQIRLSMILGAINKR